jgi:chemotaxis protein methyltransferase CheR
METSSSFLVESDEALSDQNFWQLAQFIHDYCGIRITAKKRSMIDGRLRRRMRTLGIANINDYCGFLFDEEGHACNSEVVHFIDAITTNKTDFFREPAHFDYIEAQILPAYARAGKRKIKVWSAACSTGAEPYTLAMVLEDFQRTAPGIGYSILATDLCTEVLNKGLDGCYPEMMLAPIPEERRRRYVMIARSPGFHEFRIVPSLRSKVTFTQLNLMEESYPFDADFDMIFCRNILIYFDRPTQGKVLNNLCRHLRTGGFLFLGHSETVSGVSLPLAPVATTIYQRI